MPIKAELDHLGLNSSDPAQLAVFYGRVLGMASRRHDDQYIVEARERTLVIGPGVSGTLRFAAYRLPDVAALDALKQRLTAHHATWRLAESELLGGEPICVEDPDGNLLVFGIGGERTGALTDPVALRPARLQHVVFASRDAARLAGFYRDALGFVPTDEVLDDQGVVRTTFLRSSEEHHSLAVFQASENRLDHCCYEAGNWDLIRDWADHMAGEYVPLKWGPGRHGPGNNLFFFVHDCDGNWVEISAELERVDADRPLGTWPHEERTLNSWGVGLLRS